MTTWESPEQIPNPGHPLPLAGDWLDGLGPVPEWLREEADASWAMVQPPECEQEPEESWFHIGLGLALLAATTWLVLVLAGVLG